MAVVVRPVIGLRRDPRSQSEMVTQEVWGRQLSVIGSRGDWLQCEARDGMRGWVPGSSVTEEDPLRPTHVVVKRFGRMACGKGAGGLMLPMGSLVAVAGLSGRRAHVAGPDGSRGVLRTADIARLGRGGVGPRKAPGPQRAAAIMERIIPEVLGTPYLWGGRSTFGFDCSGLVQTLYEFVGVRLPRDSRDQAARGYKVRRLGSLRPLDLVFFGRGAHIDHVAVHTGDLGILHASGYVRFESLDPDSPRFRGDLRRRFAWATRLIR